jgi:hypothetical protein
MGAQQNPWLVDFDAAAVQDLEQVKSRGDRKAVFSVVEKLQVLGPDLPPPHVKSLSGEADLLELRPKQGASAVRLIFCRTGRRFVVLAVAPDKPSFDRHLLRARIRLDARRRAR